jgi:hypothetical protein
MINKFNFIYNNNIIMTKKQIYELTNDEINEFIHQLLPIKKEEKDRFGEVFTHPKLINLILDLFPKSVFTNPNLKWLDPAVGAGFFMILVYQRLMIGLSEWEANIKKRSDYIIGNMLYMVEINRSNCNICKNFFGPKINLICKDFLSEFHFPKLLEMRFDCIIGNPPFQDDFGLTDTGKRILGGKNKLYERFFIKSYSLLKEGGYLSFLVPDNLFSGNGSDSYQILLKNNVPFISFNPSIQYYFPGIQQTICYFLMKKINTNTSLTVVESGDTNKIKIQLQNRPVNPVKLWTSKTEGLVNKFVSLKRNQVVYNRGKSLNLYKGNKFPIIYSPSKTLYTNKHELATGLGKKKAVIYAISTDYSFKMDFTGNMGSGPNTFYIPFQTVSEGKRLEQFLKSEDYKLLVSSTKTNRKYLKIALIEYLKFDKIMHNSTKKTKKRKHNNNSKTKKNL